MQEFCFTLSFQFPFVDTADTEQKTTSATSTSSRSNGTKFSSTSELKKTSKNQESPSSSAKHLESDNSSTKNKQLEETQRKTKTEPESSSPKQQIKEKEDIKSNDDIVTLGPALPPHLIKKTVSDCKKQQDKQCSPTAEKIDESFLNKEVIGPVLPNALNTVQQETKTSKETVKEGASFLENKTIGPVVSPETETSTKNPEPTVATIGPILPPHLRQKLLESFQEDVPTPVDDDDDAFGPLPPGVSSNSAAQRALEERALQMRLDSLNPAEKDVASREEWMLELPEVHAGNLGLGPRQFRAKSGPDMSDR